MDCGEERHRFVLLDDRGERQSARWVRNRRDKIEEAVAQSTELMVMISKEPQIAELIEDAKRLEGIAAHHSVHAAGLVIGPEELYSFRALWRQYRACRRNKTGPQGAK